MVDRQTRVVHVPVPVSIRRRRWWRAGRGRLLARLARAHAKRPSHGPRPVLQYCKVAASRIHCVQPSGTLESGLASSGRARPVHGRGGQHAAGAPARPPATAPYPGLADAQTESFQ
eukprot:scaffold170_cov411-Prasinococcus_capsulatus_cf.AAC.2